MNKQNTNLRFICLLASPLVIIFLGFITATVFSNLIDEWAWIPLALVYWGLLGTSIYIFKGNVKLNHWLQKSKRAPVWNIITVLIGFIPLSILVMNYHLFDSIWLIAYWLLFALINPWFEEFYWRAVLFDGLLIKLPKWIVVIYTTLFYVISHPLMWGVFSVANKSVHLYIYLTLIGVIWAITYLKTKSLRFVIFSHFIVDIGNLSVLTFLNIYSPPSL